MTANRVSRQRVALRSALAAVVLAFLPAHAHAGPDPLQVIADAYWGEEFTSTMISVAIEVPSMDLSARECSVRLEIEASFEKPRRSYNIDERMHGKSIPKNCNSQSLRTNFVRVEIVDYGSALLSSTHSESFGQTVSGATTNFSPVSQSVPLYTAPFDQHLAGSRITYDWIFYLQFGGSSSALRICAHAETIFPAPIKGGWGPCSG